MRIAFIGLGNMGGSMALNLMKAGHTLVVHDVRKEAGSPHVAQGAKWAESVRDAASQGELILTSLPGPPEVEAVALGPEGFTLGGKAGVKPEALLEAIRGASFGQGLILSHMIPDVVLKGDFDNVRFALKPARKDVGLATALAREYDVPMPIAAVGE